MIGGRVTGVMGGVPNTVGIGNPEGFSEGSSPIFTYPYSITGVTKDSNGTPLAGANVHEYRTIDDSFVHQTTSDANGNYVIPASQTLQHYLVAYKAGSPDVAGTTVNTLTGT